MLSKRSTYIALTILAALSVEIGCGDGSHKVATRKSLDAKAGNGKVQAIDPVTGKPMVDKSGKPVMVDKASMAKTSPATGSTADKTTQLTNLNVPKADPQLKTIADNEDQQIGRSNGEQLPGSLSPREQLDSGAYTLESIVTSVHLTSTDSTEEARAFQTSTYDSASRHLSVTSSANGGMISNFTDTPRRVRVPVSFKINLSSGAWSDPTQAANFTFQNKVSLAADNSGKIQMQDTPNLDDSSNQAALFTILKDGVLQKNGTYLMEIDHVTTVLRILKKDAKHVSFAMWFEEMRDLDGKSPQKLNMDRVIVFGFNVTPDTSASSGATAAAAGETGGQASDEAKSISVESTTTGKQLE